jgi:SAM-dependent methyltransferase
MTAAGMESAYHATRFQFDPRRKIVWEEIVRYFGGIAPLGDTVLDLGCGYGEFINSVQARQRYALDLEPAQQQYLNPGIEFAAENVLKVDELYDPASFSFIFSSNLLEHLERAEVGQLLVKLRNLLKPGGHLGIMMPNYRLKPHLYFDDYTHKTAISDVALCDWMSSVGLEVVRSEPGFLPYSMKARLPVNRFLVRLWLASPFRPNAGQMLVIARRPV